VTLIPPARGQGVLGLALLLAAQGIVGAIVGCLGTLVALAWTGAL
jgi:hypothetical protein